MPEGGLFINTLLLQDHCQKIRDEEYIAKRLADLLEHLHIAAKSENDLRFSELPNQGDRIVSFFHGMADTLESSSYDFSRISLQIRDMLEESYNLNS